MTTPKARILPPDVGASPAHVLSKTSASILVNKSPLHARMRKMREAPDETSDEMDLGTIVHALMLGASGNRKIVVLDYPDFRKKEARAARDEVLARGDVPVLAHKNEWISSRARKLAARCEALGFAFTGESEVGIEWSEFASGGDEVTCWGALDHLIVGPSRALIVDLKIVESAHPRSAQKHIHTFGGDVQAAAYTRAIEALHPHLAGRVAFVFLFCELHSGAVTPVRLGGTFRRLGELKWQRAIDTWARCLRTGDWPSYASETITIDAPTWAIDEEAAHVNDENARRGEAFLEDDDDAF
jgi:hypothetical protein